MDLAKSVQMWIDRYTETNFGKEFRVSLHQSPHDTDNPSTYIDFDSDKFLARATLWSSGEYQEEAIDVESGETIYWNYYSTIALDGVGGYLDVFVDRLHKLK